MPGEPLEAPGAIYNSNRFTLRGAARRRWAARCSDLGIVPDRARRDARRRCATRARGQRPDRHLAAASRSARRTTSSPRCRPRAGSTCGRSRSSPASRSRSARWPATAARRCFIGLPGNPVSSFVTFLLLVRPFLLQLQGATRVRAARRSRCAPTSTGRSADRRREFLRVRRNARRRPRPVPEPELGRADLDRLGRRRGRQPAGQGHRAGDAVRFLPFAELLR